MIYKKNYKKDDDSADDEIRLLPIKKCNFTFGNVYSFLLLLFSVTSTVCFVYLTIILSSIYSKINIEALEELNVTQINEMYQTLMEIKSNGLIECLIRKCRDNVDPNPF